MSDSNSRDTMNARSSSGEVPTPCASLPWGGLPGFSSAGWGPEGDSVGRMVTEKPCLVAPTSPGFDAWFIRCQFPLLEERVDGKRVVWLDNATTTQKPRRVIDRLTRFYEHEHGLPARAAVALEAAREAMRHLINAEMARDVRFVNGAAEGVRAVAQRWAVTLSPGDEVLAAGGAHLGCWQAVAASRGAKVKLVPCDDAGVVHIDLFRPLVTSRTRIVALTHVASAAGTLAPVELLTSIARRARARVLVDGTQAIAHVPVDVQAIGCDAYVISGQHAFGPTGSGAVFCPDDAADDAGLVADAVSLGAAAAWLLSVGMKNVAAFEEQLLEHTASRLAEVPGATVPNGAAGKIGVLPVSFAAIPAEEVAASLARDGIFTSTSAGCLRVAAAVYNSREDIDALVEALKVLRPARLRLVTEG